MRTAHHEEAFFSETQKTKQIIACNRLRKICSFQQHLFTYAGRDSYDFCVDVDEAEKAAQESL